MYAKYNAQTKLKKVDSKQNELLKSFFAGKKYEKRYIYFLIAYFHWGTAHYE